MEWRENDYTSVWLEIPAARSALVATATAQFDFELHHVNAANSTILMKKWLRLGLVLRVS